LIEINLTIFSRIYYAGNGAAICVASGAKVLPGSDAFLNCSTADDGNNYCGGCAYLMPVDAGTAVVDRCATDCRSWAGSFAYGDGGRIELRGLSVFDCQSDLGALDHATVRLRAVESNFTGLKAAWSVGGGEVAVLFEESLPLIVLAAAV
jgi:hypothetical protein